MEEDFETIDLLEIARLLRRHAVGIIATSLAAAIIGLLVTAFLITPQYEASATMIVNTRQDQTATVTNDQLTSAKNLVSTYSIIVRSDTVLSQVIKKLNLPENYEQLSEKVKVSAVDSTQVMRVSFQDADPQRAKSIVAEITKIAPGVIQDMVEAGSVKVISESRVGDSPISPSKKKNTAIAGLLGLAVSMGVVVLREMLNTTIKTSEELQDKLGLTVLGVIPDID